VYRMLVPVDAGGEAVDFLTFLAVVETVAEGCGAAGWNVATSSASTIMVCALPPEGRAAIYAGGPDVPLAGSGFPPSGTATPLEGGFRIRGRWRFGSGCLEAQWMIAPCTLASERGYVLALVPRAQCQVHDTWDVIGLRGTGSHDWSVDDVLVPESRAVVMPPDLTMRWPSGERVPLT